MFLQMHDHLRLQDTMTTRSCCISWRFSSTIKLSIRSFLKWGNRTDALSTMRSFASLPRSSLAKTRKRDRCADQGGTSLLGHRGGGGCAARISVMTIMVITNPRNMKIVIEPLRNSWIHSKSDDFKKLQCWLKFFVPYENSCCLENLIWVYIVLWCSQIFTVKEFLCWIYLLSPKATRAA